MHHRFGRLALVLCAAAGPLCIAASTNNSGAIGLATTSGSLSVDNATVQGSASLLNGSQIATTDNPSQVTLRGGARVDLATQSSGRVYADHFVLEHGTSKARGVTVVVNGLRVVPQDRSEVEVTTESSTHFGVQAAGGWAKVLNGRGALVAEVMRGSALSFVDQGTGAGAPTQITGCVQQVKGTNSYVVRDETTNVIYEVQGPDIAANVGKNVQITGGLVTTGTPVTGASQLLSETSLTGNPNGKGCKPSIPAAAAAAGAGAAAVGGGLSGVTIAIISGVAVAGVIGGLAAAGTFSSSSSTPTVSQ